ncbi:MAG: putative RNA-binding protein with PUA-like domain [Bacteriovoracaceae bacterium]|jgi:predicted RNA-binding protein with PUA-like domain
MKTEPQNFSITDLQNETNQSTTWDGVRNYQARNFMRDEMKKGDLVLFYHSSCKEVGIAGIAIVSKESHPDLSALDSKSKYFDPKATKDEPRWYMVDVKWKKTFKRIITLAELKENTQLQEMKLLKKGNRLSIMPVTKSEFNIILDLV